MLALVLAIIHYSIHVKMRMITVEFRPTFALNHIFFRNYIINDVGNKNKKLNHRQFYLAYIPVFITVKELIFPGFPAFVCLFAWLCVC